MGPVCWEACKLGYTDTGLLCTRGAVTKLKGCCCINMLGKKTCCDNCESGYADTGCTCYRGPDTYSKKSEGRGAGTPLICANNQEEDGALCYKKCKSGYKGIG